MQQLAYVIDELGAIGSCFCTENRTGHGGGVGLGPVHSGPGFPSGDRYMEARTIWKHCFYERCYAVYPPKVRK